MENFKKEFEDCGWIWYDHCGYDDVNVFMLARKEFFLEKIPDKAEIKITADSRYKLYINGNFVNYGPARGFPESYPFDRVDISKYLKKGKNVIGVIVWQWGHGTFQSIYGGAGGLIISGKIDEVDISTKRDNGYLVKKCEGHKQDMVRKSLQLPYQEYFDARKIDDNWLYPESNIKEGMNGWRKPFWRMVGCAPWFKLEERGIPLLKYEKKLFKKILFCYFGNVAENWENVRNITEIFLKEKEGTSDFSKIKKVENLLRDDNSFSEIYPFPKNKKITLILDFGEEVVGFLGIDIEGEGGEVFDLTTSEVLENGNLCIKDPTGPGKIAISDRFIARKGRNNFETFSIHGFRYLALTIRNVTKKLKIYKIYVRKIEYPFENETYFQTDDEIINSIWDICIRTQKCCSLDAYIDCPWREQAQWWGDARIQGINTYYAFGDMRLLKRGIKQGGQSQIENGLTYGHFPTIAVNCILPDFTLTWIDTHLDYYHFTGEKELMREQFEKIKKAINFFVDFISKNYLLGSMPEFWVFLDWAPLYKEGFSAVFNMMFLNSIRTMLKICRILRKYEDFKYYEKIEKIVKNRIIKIFWDNREKIFWDGYDTKNKEQIKRISQHSHSLAILLDLKPRYHKDWIENILLPPMKLPPLQHEKIIECSPFFYFYTVEAIKRVGGYENEIIEFIKRRWGQMIKEGSTTCYEKWNPAFGYNSLCHGWSAHPIVHFIELLGNVKPVAPKWSSIEIKNKSINLEYMKIKKITEFGLIEIVYKDKEYKIKIPEKIKILRNLSKSRRTDGI